MYRYKLDYGELEGGKIGKIRDLASEHMDQRIVLTTIE